MRRRLLTPAEVEQARHAEGAGLSETRAATFLGRLRVGRTAGEARTTATPARPWAAGSAPISEPAPREDPPSTRAQPRAPLIAADSPPRLNGTMVTNMPLAPASSITALQTEQRPPPARPRRTRPLQARRLERPIRPLQAKRSFAVMEDQPVLRNPGRKLPKRPIHMSDDVHFGYRMAAPPRR